MCTGYSDHETEKKRTWLVKKNNKDFALKKIIYFNLT